MFVKKIIIILYIEAIKAFNGGKKKHLIIEPGQGGLFLFCFAHIKCIWLSWVLTDFHHVFLYKQFEMGTEWTGIRVVSI